ncbi:hypothetical protein AB1283_01765 [Bacillus sp. S13(2024)]|uniref:hypothetical protein n=1 Tax=unclassified Bacillus (in: firmicutes) TaxID=185979 RepID=UPI003D24B47D
MDATQAFLLELHNIIKEYSMVGNQLTNPSKELMWEEFNLTKEEFVALQSQSFTPESITAIEKIVRDNIMGAFHDALSLLDGVSDPTVANMEDIWVGLKLEEKQEDEEEEELFLHDKLSESYWDWLNVQEKE